MGKIFKKKKILQDYGLIKLLEEQGIEYKIDNGLVSFNGHLNMSGYDSVYLKKLGNVSHIWIKDAQKSSIKAQKIEGLHADSLKEVELDALEIDTLYINGATKASIHSNKIRYLQANSLANVNFDIPEMGDVWIDNAVKATIKTNKISSLHARKLKKPVFDIPEIGHLYFENAESISVKSKHIESLSSKKAKVIDVRCPKFENLYSYVEDDLTVTVSNLDRFIAYNAKSVSIKPQKNITNDNIKRLEIGKVYLENATKCSVTTNRINRLEANKVNDISLDIKDLKSIKGMMTIFLSGDLIGKRMNGLIFPEGIGQNAYKAISTFYFEKEKMFLASSKLLPFKDFSENIEEIFYEYDWENLKKFYQRCESLSA